MAEYCFFFPNNETNTEFMHQTTEKDTQLKYSMKYNHWQTQGGWGLVGVTAQGCIYSITKVPSRIAKVIESTLLDAFYIFWLDIYSFPPHDISFTIVCWNQLDTSPGWRIGFFPLLYMQMDVHSEMWTSYLCLSSVNFTIYLISEHEEKHIFVEIIRQFRK